MVLAEVTWLGWNPRIECGYRRPHGTLLYPNKVLGNLIDPLFTRICVFGSKHGSEYVARNSCNSCIIEVWVMDWAVHKTTERTTEKPAKLTEEAGVMERHSRAYRTVLLNDRGVWWTSITFVSLVDGINQYVDANNDVGGWAFLAIMNFKGSIVLRFRVLKSWIFPDVSLGWIFIRLNMVILGENR